MLKNYFKIALRHLVRQKGYSLINIIGLAAGLSCAILILLWVQDELSYDRFHRNAGTIYRVVAEWKENNSHWAKTPGELAAAVQENLPEVANAARLHRTGRMAIRYGDKAFYEDAILRADPSLLEIFDFPMAAGKREAMLSGMVITEAMAQKYFGGEEPVGKMLNVNNWYDIPVTGVLKNLPRNSSMQFAFLTELESLKKFWPGGFTWSNFSHETYVQLEKDVDPEIAGEKITELLRRNAPTISPYLNKLYLQPLSEVYLGAEIGGNQFAASDRKYVYIFSAVALFVLITACINFMNLSTARSLNRAREVGLRKVVGSSRAQLIGQFLGESIFFTAAAAFFALILAELLLPLFNQLAEKSLALNYADPKLLLGVAVVTLATGVVSGSYPALYLSSFKPVHALKGLTIFSFDKAGKRGGFRRILVVTQFVLSIMLLIGTTVIYKQLHYMTHLKLGFDKDNIVYVPAKANIGTQYEAFKTGLLQHPEIAGVAIKESLPTNTVNTNLVFWDGKPTDRDFAVEAVAVDYACLDLLNLEIIAGRDFDKVYAADASSSFIINEEAMRMMDMAAPVGKEITLGRKKGTVVGVIKDAHFKSLRQKIEPQVFHVLTDYRSELVDLFGIVMIKVRGNEIPRALEIIAQAWRQINPQYPFEYHFLDETYERLYDQEQRTSTIFNSFTVLALTISCLGLFGLAAFIAENRTKEIGIRKVLGAPVSKIIFLLTSDFAKWVLLANIIAWPLGWFLMSRWLQDFAYRIEMGWWIFALAGGTALLIALLTVSTQAVKAALGNPAEALRYE